MVEILLATLILVGTANFVLIFVYLLRHHELKNALYLNADHTLAHLRTETSLMHELGVETLPKIESSIKQLHNLHHALEREQQGFIGKYKDASRTMQAITQDQRETMIIHRDIMEKLTRTQNHLSKALRQRDKLRKQVAMMGRKR